MKMKKEVTICDMCGCEYDDRTGWHMIPDGEFDGEDAFIGVRAMFSNCGVGSKYDLCKECTLKIVKKFVAKMEKD